MKKNKVFFVDDHEALRDALADMVTADGDFRSVGVASNGAEAIAAFENGLLTDIIMLDLKMPVMDGYAVAEWLTINRPEVKILILTMGIDNSRLEFLLSLNVAGIVNKDVKRPELKAALESVAAGNTYYSSSINNAMTEHILKQQVIANKKAELKLTEPDMEYIGLCAKGLTDKEIAGLMGLSRHVIERMGVKVRTALNTKNRAELAIRGAKLGIVDLEDAK